MILQHIKQGQCFKILGYDVQQGTAGYRQRLLSMGLIPGINFVVRHLAPLGDTIHIECIGTSLLLRLKEASCLQVEAQ
jgi:ferrous iron transport protein A